MKFALVRIILSIALLALALPAAADTILNCDFEGMTVDQPIGTGGPTMGEPYLNYACVANISDTPMTSRCLGVSDNSASNSGTLIFSFLMDSEPSSGIVEISADLWFEELGGYKIYVREFNGAADSYNNIRFNDNGSIYISSEGWVGAFFGSYNIGQKYTIQIVHDLDAGSYDIFWDGELLVSNQAHGLTENGIGTVYFGHLNDDDLDGTFYMDNFVVTASSITPTSSLSWGSLKGLYR